MSEQDQPEQKQEDQQPENQEQQPEQQQENNQENQPDQQPEQKQEEQPNTEEKQPEQNEQQAENKEGEQNQAQKEGGEQQQQQEEQQQQPQDDGEKKEDVPAEEEDAQQEQQAEEGVEPGEEGEEDQYKRKEIPEDFYYEDDHFEVELPDSPIPTKICDFYESFGFDSHRKQNVQILDMDNMIYSGGVNYFIVNIIDGETQIFFSKDGGGIGAIAVHPSKKYFAVAEKGDHPNIYVYEYPSLKLYRILRKGTERSFSCCNFSQSGDILASVGSASDYTISLWNWKQEFVILKSKAFSQEVYSIKFSEYSEHILTTAGLAHIKFWKVAETFTGLKLKDEIAKFGQIELSDVMAYYTYPDGKVLSSTEYGKLLLWEGNLIKAVINISASEDGSEVVDCHKDDINVIFRKDNDIITAGKDGFIKFWDANVIDAAESDDFSQFYMKPLHEIQLFTSENVPCNIINISTFDNFWLVQDQNGKILKLEISDNKADFDQKTIKITNSGKIRDVAISPIQNSSITIGDDGVLRLWDYVNQREYFSRVFSGRGTCVEMLPYNRKNQGRLVLAGFDNGIVRWVLINQTGFHLLRACKVHSDAIKLIKATPDGQNLAILANNGDLFIIEQNQNDLQKIDPFCLYETKLQARDMQWDKMGEKLLFACSDGKIYESTVLKKEECDTESDTYLKEFNARSWTMKMMEFQKPKTEEMDLTFLLKHKAGDDKKEFEEWEPAPIMNATYYDAACTKVLISVEGQYAGWLYLVDWKKDRPIEAFPAPKAETKFMKFQNYDDFLLIGFTDGTFQIRHQYDLQQWTSIATHDSNYGHVFKVVMNFDQTALISVGGDGFQYVYKFDKKSFIAGAKGDMVEDVSYPELTNGITEGTFLEEIEINDKDEEDIQDSNIYSIQQKKLLEEEDFRKSEAEKKKKKVLEEVKKLVATFESLKEKNNQIDEVARLNNEELTLDPEYITMLNNRVQEDLEETKMEIKWEAEYHRLRTAKLKNYVKDELEVDTFTVKGIKNTKLMTTTYKVKKQSQYLEENLSIMHKEIEETKQKEEQEREMALKEENMKQGGAEQNIILKENNINEEKEENKEDELEEANLTGAKLERLKHKREEARIKRELEELEKQRSAHQSSEPDHIKEIDEAKRNLGDYKLKSDPDYEVQESQRKNVSKQRKYMFLLEEYIYNRKQDFNNVLISLKNRKLAIIDKIRSYNLKIKEINKQLGIQEELFQPEIDKALEEPESYYEISKEELEAYEKQKIQEKNPDKAPPKKGQQEQSKTEKKKDMQASQQPNDFKARKGQKVQPSELEEELKKINEMILTGEKKRMQDEINEEIEQFDVDIAQQVNKKNHLQSDIIVSHMNLDTYYQELILLVDMEEYDNYLIKNLLECKNQKQELNNESSKIVKELNELVAKDTENEKQHNEKMKEFKELVHPDDDHKREKLRQYWYKKHTKLQQKKIKHAGQDDGDDDEDDEDMESDEEDEDDDFMDDDDDERVDMSPIETDNGTNKALLDKICELEDNQNAFREQKIEKERAKIQIANKIQNVLKDLQRAQNELKDYQRKKLGKVNQLDVSFCLKLSQIKNLIFVTEQQENIERYCLPQNLEQSILFTQDEFSRLSRRIKELEFEKRKIEKHRRRLEATKKKRQKEIQEKTEKYDELNKKYQEKHVLKFGDVIDLKVLDALQPTKQVLEMRDKFKQEEREAIKRVEQAKLSLLAKKQQLLETRRENTKIIKIITKLGEDRMKLNKKLDQSNKQLFKEENEDKKNKNDLEKEKQNLIDLVKFLSKEINDLRKEISLFNRKGGHIYTMVTSNKKNFG